MSGRAEPVVILGAGLTGLSCAYHLGDRRPYLLFEAQERPGGLCRSRRVRGFTFDCTGHLLHLRDPYVTQLVLEELLPGVFRRHPRRAFIHSFARYTPYPFQANLFGLPKPVVRDCLLAYLNAPRVPAPANFAEWARATFGEGIYEHFMRPFNEKLWRVPLTELTHEWCSWSVPRPSVEEVVNGAIGLVNKGMGYNPTFYYPKAGGIEVLPQAFARRCHNLHTGHRVTWVDVRRRRVGFENGREELYEKLVTTIPLDELLSIARGGPGEWRDVGRRLRRVPILSLNLGVEGLLWGRRQWVYFPEPEFPFYRVGVASNFEPHLAPRQCSSLYVEVSLPSPAADIDRIASVCIERLRALGMKGRIRVRDSLVIPCAYVVHDAFRREAVPRTLAQLRELDVLSTGRYGAWTYSYMERAILDGREAATWAAQG